MHGFGSHTYSFINSENKRFWVKEVHLQDPAGYPEPHGSGSGSPCG
ncbi:hypothetical protein [Edaphobacter aggregans]